MIDPIDDLIQPLLISGSLSDIDKLKLHEALMRLSDSGLRAKQVTNPHLGDSSVTSRTIAPGAVIASALTDGVKSWNTNVVFSASDADTVAWTGASLRFADGTVSSISAGNTGNMTALTYIYYDSGISITTLQTSTAFADAVGDNKILLCVAEDTSDATQEAFYVPAIGVFGINETTIGPNSISTGKIQALAITVNEIAANTITAAKMNVSLLSAISANIGTITAGSLDAVTITAGTITGTIFKTAAANRRIEIDSTNGVRSYNAAGTLRAQLNDNDLNLSGAIGPINASDDLIFGDSLTGATATGKRTIRTGRSGIGAEVYIELNEGTAASTDAMRIVCGSVQRHSIDGNGDWTVDSGDFTVTSGTISGAGSGITGITGSQTGITGIGTITTGVWNGTVIASAYLDADTAHLATTQTFTGAKTFNENVTLSSADLILDNNESVLWGTDALLTASAAADSMNFTTSSVKIFQVDRNESATAIGLWAMHGVAPSLKQFRTESIDHGSGAKDWVYV